MEPASLKESAAVVIDVLRATTSMAHALSHDCAGIIPRLTVGEALEYRTRNPNALLGGERKGLRLPGFDLGNSPCEYGPNVAGRLVCMTTTNGTKAIHASQASPLLMAAAFVNLSATAAHIRREGFSSVGIVCSGTDGDIAYEDILCAGALVSHLLQDQHNIELNDSARIALGAWESCSATGLVRALASARGGQERTKEDIALAASVDVCPVAAVMDTKRGMICRVDGN